MKNYTKILLVAAIIGGVAAAAGAYSGSGTVVAEGTYENKGQIAKWEIRDKDGVLTAYIQFPGNKMTELATQGSLEGLGQLIDLRMRENGYLPSGVGMTQGDAQQAGFSAHSNAQQAGLSG